jgi:hypothetical protein
MSSDTPNAIRLRKYPALRHRAMRCVTIRVADAEIETLRERGYEIDTPADIAEAVETFISDVLA